MLIHYNVKYLLITQSNVRMSKWVSKQSKAVPCLCRCFLPPILFYDRPKDGGSKSFPDIVSYLPTTQHISLNQHRCKTSNFAHKRNAFRFSVHVEEAKWGWCIFFFFLRRDGSVCKWSTNNYAYLRNFEITSNVIKYLTSTVKVAWNCY
jgi:hypothetical protein